MNLFVWQRIAHVSENYHDEGGLLVIAKNLERAREIATENGCKGMEIEPSFSCQLAGWVTEEKFMGFPDSGCC